MRIAKAIFATMLALTALPAHAQSMPSIDDIVSISLLQGWTEPDGSSLGALQVTLAPGWKTYWRVGGETGIPPVFDWSGSENLASVAYHWPRPELIEQDGILILGFHNQLVLPITFVPTVAGVPIDANAVLDIGVCDDVCIPVRTSIAATMGEGDANARFLIELALATQPDAAGGPQARCRISRGSDGTKVSALVGVTDDTEPNAVVVFETDRPDTWIAPARAHRAGDGMVAETQIMDYSGTPEALRPSDLRLTFLSANAALDLGPCLGD